MKIIKESENAVDIIAGEMLNYELSLQHYTDGVANTLSSSFTVDDYRGYPRIVSGNVTYTVRGTVGHIYVPVGCDLASFAETLSHCITEKEKTLVRLDGTAVKPLKNYHTTQATYMTNTKIIPAMNTTQFYTDTMSVVVKPVTNIKRVIVCHGVAEFTHPSRFTWFITPIEKFDPTISSYRPEDVIARQVVSIFYDGDNICTLEHGATVTDFSTSYLKGFANILPDCGMIKLSASNVPLLYELTPYWRTAVIRHHREIERGVVSIPYEQLQIKPVRINEVDEVESTDICHRCKDPLWGDFYAMLNHIKDRDAKTADVYCAACVHTATDKPIENKYFNLYRVTHPRTMISLLDTVPQPRRDILAECLKGIVEHEVDVDGVLVQYILIGEKYVAFSETGTYLYTHMTHHPTFKGRQVCSATLCH